MGFDCGCSLKGYAIALSEVMWLSFIVYWFHLTGLIEMALSAMIVCLVMMIVL